ncbi:hypothetical protein [Salinibacter ruber]|uniref:Uncharacterized protein n=1 Tax=Salinibacter ruber TaxID=146919 RepID=A0AAW5P8J0_9BACT|nr:hypothetical protein [Salinibacter ruber]MCS4157725.1 hypothetical protein [Salinibacter ruber]
MLGGSWRPRGPEVRRSQGAMGIRGVEINRSLQKRIKEKEREADELRVEASVAEEEGYTDVAAQKRRASKRALEKASRLQEKLE